MYTGMINTEMRFESSGHTTRDELGCRTARKLLQAKRNIFSVEIRMSTFNKEKLIPRV